MAKEPEGPRILIVDDEPDFREALAFLFRKRGYRVSLAGGGTEAFERIQRAEFDLVVSDIRMPGGDGIELLDLLRKENRQMPIVLLVTGFSDITTALAREKGAKALFSKPFDPRAFDEMIQGLLSAAGSLGDRSARARANPWTAELQFEGERSLTGISIDPDRSGMFVELPRGTYPDVNTGVVFRLTHERAEKPFVGTGVVRWVQVKEGPPESADCGIEFTQFDRSEWDRFDPKNRGRA
jgi:CheY-like chemotaxis protein